MPEDEIFRTTLPPGRHRLPRDFVEQHQRARLFAAIVKLVDERGYPATSLTQIVKTAGVARHTFYEHFEDKEALFLALFDETVEAAMRAIEAAIDAESGPWEEKTRAGMSTLLELVVANPARTRVFMIESQSAGPAALARRDAAMERFGALLRTGREEMPAGRELPDSLEDILVGGIVWMINKWLVSAGERTDELLAEILEFVISPYRGNARAREAAAAGGAREDPPAAGG